MPSDAGTLPNFICVGPGRSGTSWLYEVLLSHPDVWTAKDIKETEYFNSYYERGMDWYRKFFVGSDLSSARGEVSNRYIFSPSVPARISRDLPGCKIIICVRNPYERIQSLYSFKLREGALDCSFEDAMQSVPELIHENRYCTFIKPYLELFGREKIFFLYHEEIASRPHRLCRELFRFIGAREDFVPDVASKRFNRAVVPRFRLASLLTKSAAGALRSAGLYSLLTRAKRSEKIKNIFFKEYRYQDLGLITPFVKQTLDPVFMPEIEELEKLLGTSLSHWVAERDPG